MTEQALMKFESRGLVKHLISDREEYLLQTYQRNEKVNLVKDLEYCRKSDIKNKPSRNRA